MNHEELTKYELFHLRILAAEKAYAARQAAYDVDPESKRYENLCTDEEYYSDLAKKVRVMEEAR